MYGEMGFVSIDLDMYFESICMPIENGAMAIAPYKYVNLKDFLKMFLLMAKI